MAGEQVAQLTMETVKKQLLQEALDIIKSTKEGVLKAFDYLQAQVPDLIKQFLTWEFSIGVICLIIGLCFTVLGIWLFRRGIYFMNKTQDYGDIAFGCFFAGVSSMIIGLSFTIANVIKITMITVAPKIFLIKWLIANIQMMR